MKIAALDLGTNSFLCLIAEIEKNNDQFEIKKVISDQVEIVRLGEDVQKSKKFHPDALKRAESCLMRFKKEIDLQKPEKILAMATSAARDVSNSQELFKIAQNLDIPLEIIPGHKEAEITFSGSISGTNLNQGLTAVIDVGGGSTEIIIGNKDKISFSKSADVGAVRISEMFFPKQPPRFQEFEMAEKYIYKQLEFLKNPVQQLMPEHCIAVAGTPTELAKIAIGSFDRKKIDGFLISLQTLEDWQNKFLATTSHEREQLYNISTGRADVILAGTMILKASLKALGLKNLMVSTRGVRYGVALELARRSL
jgi:exopolyphosphatase/guanosine-5'-triphosphate,3'-diphosphate pyrophosphatase